MNRAYPPHLERDYREAKDQLWELENDHTPWNMDAKERKAYRQMLAYARFQCEMARIELESAWTPPAEWFAKTA